MHRVKRPDAEPFKDLVHYDVFGPTAIATNQMVPTTMHSRGFPIPMPLVPGAYAEPDSVEGLRLRERLLAFRARVMLGGVWLAMSRGEGVGDGLH